MDLTLLVQKMKMWAQALGFSDLRVSDVMLPGRLAQLELWLARGFHGDMDYLANNIDKRVKPELLVEGTIRVISLQMPYLNKVSTYFLNNERSNAEQSSYARISLYARGRDYHRVIRSRLQKLVDKMQSEVGAFNYRVFTDSAPVLEVELAQKAGVGWRGKHGLLVNQHSGSFFFLGEIFIDLPLPVDKEAKSHCGRCDKCMTVCPTQAIIAPYTLDARRCISYLTIEMDGPIPLWARPLIGNRIYGCDECQLCCPWNRFAQKTRVADFEERAQFSHVPLVDLFQWDKEMFLEQTQGTAIRRIGYNRWMRNIAVALGNALRTGLSVHEKQHILSVLSRPIDVDADWVKEHVDWAKSQYYVD